MALIDLDKFVASFITEMRECSQMRNFSIPRCIKKALVDQGLDYKGGEIIKTQCRVSAEAKENGYGESEDERIRKEIIAILQYKYKNFSNDPKYRNAPQWIAWLEKQGERKPTEWSKEDDVMVHDILGWLPAKSRPEYNQRRIDWLKFLKERVQPQNNIVTDKELAQAKKEAYNETLDKIEYHSGEPTFDDGWNAAIWFLKKRNGRPQNTWKPSNEQIIALRWVLNNIPYNKHKEEISGLLEQLKKLKGE